MLTENDYLRRKKDLMLEIASTLDNWNESVEDALKILEENNKRFKKLAEIDIKLSDDELETFNKESKKDWKVILKKQKELTMCIREEHKKVQEQLSQVSNKQKIVTNYISLKEKSIFVEEDY